MNYILAIPSKGRMELKTYHKFLTNFPRDVVNVFVEPQEYKDYEYLNGVLNVVKLEKDNMGVGYARQFMVNYAKSKNIRNIIMLDDNIKGFEKRGEFMRDKESPYYKLEKIDDGYDVMFEDLVNTMNELEYAQLGMSFSGSNWLCVDDIKDRCRVWGVFAIDVTKLNNINFDEQCLLCQDFEFTIQLIEAKLKVGVYYKYAFDKVMAEGKGGGNSDLYKNLQKTKDVSEYIERKHGSHICKSIFNSKHNKYEISVNWANIEKHKAEHNWW